MEQFRIAEYVAVLLPIIVGRTHSAMAALMLSTISVVTLSLKSSMFFSALYTSWSALLRAYIHAPNSLLHSCRLTANQSVPVLCRCPSLHSLQADWEWKANCPHSL